MTPQQKRIRRVRTMYERQDPYRFGPEYVPARRMVRTEAPRNSRPSRLWVSRLGRELHLTGGPELWAARLALYHPAVIEIHEQNILWPLPHTHPLADMVPSQRHLPPPFRGTVDVADRLGYVTMHNRMTIRTGTSRQHVPIPYCGDMLLFIRENDAVRCVDWNVKPNTAAFSEVRNCSEHLRADREKRLRARHEIQEQYYADVGIPSARVTQTEIGRVLSTNLGVLHGFSERPLNCPRHDVDRMEQALKLSIESRTAPSTTLARFIDAGVCDKEQAITLFFQAIWYRRLRVDMFSPILIDRPQIPESEDVLERFSGWFCP